MAQVAKNESLLGGEYMIQDRDHMSDSGEVSNPEQKIGVRQVEQSQTGSRQQGGDQNTSGQQGAGQQSSEWGHLTR